MKIAIATGCRTFFGCMLALALCGGLALAQRLPGGATPVHYQIRLVPNLTAATFSGEETIAVNLAKPTNSITLNALDLKFQKVTITQKGVEQTAAANFNPTREMVTLTVPKPLAAGAAGIHILFTGILNDQLRGFYLSKGKDRNYATTQMEPTDARRAFPCFDEPAYKATWDISVVADSGDTAIANGHIVSDVPGPGADKHTITFSRTPRMSSYLVALMVGDFKCRVGASDGIPIRVCTTPDKYPLTGAALTDAEQILHFYNNYYGIKYPYGKLDIIGLPDFSAGAMENTAAITYREVLLLADPKTASPEDYETIASVLAHEMAHQWFGDLVTMQWWNDIWLNEGFATWMSSKPLAALHPEWNEREREVQSDDFAERTDSLASTRAIRTNALKSGDINQLFDAIAYNKTAAVLRMVENYVGPEVFRKGVNLYLKEHAYGNATAEDFWGAETRASGKPVDKIMSSFVEQPGIPLVTASASCRNHRTTLQLSQERFYANPSMAPAHSTEQWTIPVCVKGVDSTSCQLLRNREQSFHIKGCSPWTYTNADARGYYYSAYSPQMQQALSESFATALQPDERLKLIIDQWALVQSGRRNIGDFLNLASKLSNERDRVIWSTLGNDLAFTRDHLLNPSDKQQFQAWSRELATPLFRQLGWKPQPGESPDVKGVRAQVIRVLAYDGADPLVARQAHDLAEQLMRNPTAVDPDLQGIVLNLAAHYGDAALYDQFLAALRKSADDPIAYYNYAGALLNFRRPELVQRNLEWILTPEVRNQDATGYLFQLIGNPDIGVQAWDFMRSHWPQMKQKLASYAPSQIIYVGTSFCTPELKQQVQDFFGPQNLPGAGRPLKQTLEAISACIDVKARQEQNLQSWLVRQPSTTAAGQPGNK